MFGLFISPLLIRTEDNHDAAGPLTEVVSPSNEGEAPVVAEKVKVLCWIMTGPKTHQTKVRFKDNELYPLSIMSSYYHYLHMNL